ncbi:MAG: pyridoxamine 5'-phosphate oxidase family protein [Christensenellales bacterium]
MRRNERAITDRSRMLALLDACGVMHLGLCLEGEAYVVPLHFGWEDGEVGLRLYFHSAREGKKASWIGQGAPCAVTLTGPSGVLPGQDACGWSAHYASLMIRGRVQPLLEEEERRHGLDLILRHCGYPGQPVYRKASLEATAVYCIQAEEMTGKENQPAGA